MTVDPAVDAFFARRPASRALFEAVRACVDAIGPFELRASKSQVTFRRRVGFAFVWVPGDYVRSDVPLVLGVGLRRRDASPRWKSVVEARPGAVHPPPGATRRRRRGRRRAAVVGGGVGGGRVITARRSAIKADQDP